MLLKNTKEIGKLMKSLKNKGSWTSNRVTFSQKGSESHQQGVQSILDGEDTRKHLGLPSTKWNKDSTQSLKESLDTGRKWVYSTPKIEKIAYIYAKSMIDGKELTYTDVAKELNTSPESVSRLVKSEIFPQVFNKYLDVESVASRHNELLHQNNDLKVSADMVKLAYKLQGVNIDKKTDNSKQKFGQFIQQINNYGHKQNNARTDIGPDVETVEPLQDKGE